MMSRRTLMTAAAGAAIAADTYDPDAAVAAPTHLDALAAPLHIGTVTLNVKDLDLVTTFYDRLVGLDVLARSSDHSVLGVDGVALLHLQRRPNAAREARGSAGLFHAAFLIPDRALLGKWMVQAAERNVPFTGMSDHKVSEALYFFDPEYNGIEVYVDRPRSAWRFLGDEIDMTTDPINGPSILAAARTISADVARMPSGTRIGHVHLRIGGVPEAERFYRGALGLDVMHRREGARFFASGGYHHHIAGNTWHSQGASQRGDDLLGLAGVELVTRTAAAFDEVALRLAAASRKVTTADDSLMVRDPWNLALTVRKLA
jgi:catechol 2,3-dioxygenase